MTNSQASLHRQLGPTPVIEMAHRHDLTLEEIIESFGQCGGDFSLDHLGEVAEAFKRYRVMLVRAAG